MFFSEQIIFVPLMSGLRAQPGLGSEPKKTNRFVLIRRRSNPEPRRACQSVPNNHVLQALPHPFSAQVPPGVSRAQADNSGSVATRELALCPLLDDFVASIQFRSYKIASLSTIRGALEIMIFELSYGRKRTSSEC